MSSVQTPPGPVVEHGNVNKDIRLCDTSASYISLTVATIWRVVIPLAYRDTIWLAICVISAFFLDELRFNGVFTIA